VGQAKRRTAMHAARLRELEGVFADIGVADLVPGFYDDPAFVKAERADQRLLEAYAVYVRLRQLTPEYEETARRLVHDVSERVCRWVEEQGDGRGRCLDAANLLSRSLDRLGIWNYMIKGSFNIRAKARPDLGPRYFWTYDELEPGATATGHVWIAAPPFVIVDPSLSGQGWEAEFRPHVPRLIVEDSPRRARMEADDMVAHEMGRPTTRELFEQAPGLKAFSETFPGSIVETDEVVARYLPAGITASDCPLEDACGGEGGRFWKRLQDEL